MRHVNSNPPHRHHMLGGHEARHPMSVKKVFAVVTLFAIKLACAISLLSIYQPIASNFSTPPTRCVSSPHWVGNGIIEEDCLDAVVLFRRAEALKAPFQLFEFKTSGVPPRYGILGIDTPRKYVSRTCALVIATLASIPAAYLPPGADLKPYPPSDVETFVTLQNAMMRVETVCIRHSQLLTGGGWVPLGQKNQALGAFIWSSSSFMNRLL